MDSKKNIEKEVNINLLDLDQYCDGIGKEKNWLHTCQKMNYLIAAPQNRRFSMFYIRIW